MAKKEDQQEVTVIGKQEATKAPTAPRSPVTPKVPITFDAWWIQVAGKNGLSQDLKNSVKRHFQARGFMEYSKFDKGLRDFGFNIRSNT